MQDFVPIRTAVTTRQPMVEFYLLTFPRFPSRKKEHKSYFGKNRTHDFRTSRCAGYLLDHSGDEDTHQSYYKRDKGDKCPDTLRYNIVSLRLVRGFHAFFWCGQVALGSHTHPLLHWDVQSFLYPACCPRLASFMICFGHPTRGVDSRLGIPLPAPVGRGRRTGVEIASGTCGLGMEALIRCSNIEAGALEQVMGLAHHHMLTVRCK